jgi:hypothetical protein
MIKPGKMNQNRKGGIAILFVILLVVVLTIAGGIFLSGKKQQALQEQLLGEGYTYFSENKVTEAASSFEKTKATFSSSLNFFRSISSSEKYVTIEEINELIFSCYLLNIYNNSFELKTSEKALKKAKEAFSSLKYLKDSSENKKSELAKVIATAEEVSDICDLYQKKKLKAAMKKLLTAEKNAAEDDQDFFVFEIRFLIACGKALREPEILKQARELLFFLNFEVGVKGEKIDQLWQLLRR